MPTATSNSWNPANPYNTSNPATTPLQTLDKTNQDKADFNKAIGIYGGNIQSVNTDPNKTPNNNLLNTWPVVTTTSATSSYISANLTSTSTTTQNSDTVVTAGFAPKTITIYYTLNGVTSGSNKYSSWIAVYNSAGTLINNTNFFTDSAATTGTFGFSNGTTAPVSGTASGTYITVALSIPTVTATWFTLRAAYAQSGWPTGAVLTCVAVVTK